MKSQIREITIEYEDEFEYMYIPLGHMLICTLDYTTVIYWVASIKVLVKVNNRT